MVIPRGIPALPQDEGREGPREQDGIINRCFLSATSAINLGEYSFSVILRCEAEEVAKGMISTGGIDWPTAAADYFLYTMRLCGMGGHLMDYDLATHGCN